MPTKTFWARLQRNQSKKMADKAISQAVEFLGERALVDTGMMSEGWRLDDWRSKPPYKDGDYTVHTIDLAFSRSGKKGVKGPAGKQFEKILAALQRAGENQAKFGIHTWTPAEPEEELPTAAPQPALYEPEEDEEDPEVQAHKMTEGGLPQVVLDASEIQLPLSLIDALDKDIEEYPLLKGIYERGPHIRILLSAMNDGLLTNFDLPTHVLLYGPTAVAKTILLKRFRTIIGEGAFLWINCPSATKAGVEWMFLKKYRNNCPRFVVLEECDKISMEVLNVLLPALDEERRITKHQHGNDDSVPFTSMVIGTCNNKRRMDSLQAGAFVNRFGLQLYCARPNPTTMRRILLDKIAKRGGDPEWADSCVEMMETFHTNDPRRVQAWLVGRERLDGRFQADIERVNRAYVEDAQMMDELSALDAEVQFSDREIALRQARGLGKPVSRNGRSKP